MNITIIHDTPNFKLTSFGNGWGLKLYNKRLPDYEGILFDYPNSAYQGALCCSTNTPPPRVLTRAYAL